MANTFTSLVSLPSPIVEGISPSDRINLQDAYRTAMSLIEEKFSGVQSAASAGVNSSIIDTGGRPLTFLQHLSFGSIATIVGCIVGKAFTLVVQSGASGAYNIIDNANFNLAGNFVPTTLDSITLVWDGSVYHEIARSVN